MDSRLIFELNKYRKIQWEKTLYPDNEWLSIKEDKLKAVEQVKDIIDSYFNTELMHVSVGRKNSFTTNKNFVLKQIEDFIHQINFHLWNENFTRTIEFNKIGVLRFGKTCSLH